VQQGFPSFVQGTIRTTDTITCTQGRGSKIDFVMVSAELAEAITIRTDQETPWSPHYGLEIAIQRARFEDKFWTLPKATPFRHYQGAPEVPWGATKEGQKGYRTETTVPPEAHDPDLTGAFLQFSQRAEQYLYDRGGRGDLECDRQGRGGSRERTQTVAVPTRPPRKGTTAGKLTHGQA